MCVLTLHPEPTSEVVVAEVPTFLARAHVLNLAKRNPNLALVG